MELLTPETSECFVSVPVVLWAMLVHKVKWVGHTLNPEWSIFDTIKIRVQSFLLQKVKERFLFSRIITSEGKKSHWKLCVHNPPGFLSCLNSWQWYHVKIRTPCSRDGQCVVSSLQTSGSIERVLDLTLWKRLNCRPWLIFAVPFIMLSLFSCHLYLCFCFSHLSSPNVFSLYWYGRLCVTLIIFIANLWIFYNSATSLWKWCDLNWMGHLTLLCALLPFEAHFELNVSSFFDGKKKIHSAGQRQYLFWTGRFIFPCKDFGHVTYNQVEGSASSMQVLYQMWKYKLLLNNALFIMH